MPTYQHASQDIHQFLTFIKLKLVIFHNHFKYLPFIMFCHVSISHHRPNIRCVSVHAFCLFILFILHPPWLAWCSLFQELNTYLTPRPSTCSYLLNHHIQQPLIETQRPKICLWTNIFFRAKNNFWSQNFFEPKYLSEPKIYFRPKIVFRNTNFFLHNLLWTQFKNLF